jgi:hypothetical protein
MSLAKIYITILLILPLSSQVLADGWPQRKGGGYYKIGFSFIRAQRFYEPDGKVISIPTLADYTASFYGEYGITDRITGIVYLPFIERITLNKQVGERTDFVFFEGDAITHPADLDVGFRVGLLQRGNTAISASIKLGIPIGQAEQPNGLVTSDGEFNQLLSLEIGQSFYPTAAYAVARAGYNNRTEGFSDEFHYGLEFGYTFAGKLTAVTRIRGVESMKNGDDAVLGGSMGLYANNQRYLAYGFEAIYAVSGNIGFSLGIEGAARGQSILSAPAFSAGVFMTM